MVNMHVNVSASNRHEYYLYYLNRHSRPWCRRMHLLGTAVGTGGVLYALFRLNMYGVLTYALVGAAICWTGDLLIQGTTPMAFSNPYWATMANFRMVKSMLTNDIGL